MSLMLTQAELIVMRQVQRSSLHHRILFQPWSPSTDPQSGQEQTDYSVQEEVFGGVDFSPKGSLVDTTEGSYVAHYRVRLPRSFAEKARPLSRYIVLEAYGDPLVPPLTLEQVSEPAVGPTGVVVWARNVL